MTYPTALTEIARLVMITPLSRDDLAPLLRAVEADTRAQIAADIEGHLLDDQPLLTYWDGMLDGLHAAARIARGKS